DLTLHQEWVVVRREAGQVEHQGLVTPRQHVVRRRIDLIGERLAPRRGLAHLEEQAGGEDALVLEPVQVDLLDPRQLSDRWHGREAPPLGRRRPDDAMRRNAASPGLPPTL